MKLQGKNIILTGVSRGFGKYLAGRLWLEGASLLLVSRAPADWRDIINPATVNSYSDPYQSIEYWREDLTGFGAGLSIVRHIMDRWDRIDGLVNSAAIQGPIGHAWEVDLIELNRTFAVDLFAPIDLCRLVVPKMLKQKHGKIVNLSGGGAANPRPNYSAYATAKAGLVRFSECLAEELKGTGIDVNCVAPGKMPTGMLPPGEVALEQTMIEAADLVIFLLSEESNGITGRLISAVWDNWRDLPNKKAELEFSNLYTLRRIGEDDEPGRSYHQHLKETGQIK